MKIKTSELKDAALDWAVATCEDEDPRMDTPYSTEWAFGGPIIEREWVEVVPWPNETDEGERWQATQHDLPHRVYCSGPTPLIAAMRCYVESRLGDEVDVPDDVLKGAELDALIYDRGDE
jgi:hypothetical protein